MATQSSILVWRIPWTEQPSGLQSIRSQRVRQDWVTNSTLLSLDYLAFNKGGSQRLSTSHASLKLLLFQFRYLALAGVFLLLGQWSWLSLASPQLKHLLLPFVEFLQGFLVEVCLSIVIAQLGGCRLWPRSTLASTFSGEKITWAFKFKSSHSKEIGHSGRYRKLCPMYAFFP